VSVVVVGAGQAGLATSRELTKAGVDHVVLERGRLAQTWRGRWDSFCLVTPNWFVRLPDGHYDGPDADGYMPRDEIVAWFERYAAACGAPVRENVDVQSVESAGDGFVLGTSDGPLHAKAVVLATGAYQRPYRPAAAETLPPDLFTIDVEGYRNEAALPPGRVLVVASRAARSPRSCTWRAGMSSSRAAARPGPSGAGAAATSPGGPMRPDSST
jgi:putative flavoprotein involved in K+ transport